MIADASRAGKPVESLLFLDKSARLGAFILRQVWREVLSRSSKLDGISEPRHYFLNAGGSECKLSSERYQSGRAHDLLRQIYDQDTFTRSTLIIDEYSISGSAARSALQTLSDVYNIDTISISHFRKTPMWWFYDRVKGVREYFFSEETSQLLREVDDGQLQSLAEFFQRLSGNDAMAVLEDVKTLSASDFILKYKVSVRDNNDVLRFFYDLSQRYSEVSVQGFIQYVRSAGGYFAAPSPTRFSVEYRSYLSSMVGTAIEQLHDAREMYTPPS